MPGGRDAPVSILISVYNAEEWVGAANRLAWPNLAPEEIIVVDDGSTGGPLPGARRFESNEVRVVTQPNQGAAAARVPSAGDTANPDELKDDLEKLRQRLQGPRPRNPGIPTVSDWLLSRLTGLLEKRHYGGENGISLPGKEAADLMTTIRAYFTCDDAKIACLSQLDSRVWQ